MGDYTTDKAIIPTSDLCDDTIVYRASKPRVRIFESDVFGTIGSILNFRGSSLRIAFEVVRRQGGEHTIIEITHPDFAAKLWGDLSPAARERKFTRGLANLKEDQEASGFCYVWIPPRRVKEIGDGRFIGLPTMYKPGDYWEVSDALQAQSNLGADLFKLTVEERRKHERQLLRVILTGRGCKRIERARKGKQAQAEGAVEPMAGRVTKDDVERWFDVLGEQMFDKGCDWASLGLSTVDYWLKIAKVISIADLRLADAIKRSNAPRVKMVGGQPK